MQPPAGMAFGARPIMEHEVATAMTHAVQTGTRPAAIAVANAVAIAAIERKSTARAAFFMAGASAAENAENGANELFAREWLCQ